MVKGTVIMVSLETTALENKADFLPCLLMDTSRVVSLVVDGF